MTETQESRREVCTAAQEKSIEIIVVELYFSQLNYVLNTIFGESIPHNAHR